MPSRTEPAQVLARIGSSGDAVLDVQQRLGALGFEVSPDEHARFGPSTAAALRAFQASRGLDPDGACDPVTWERLVEAGWSLGDRLLYLRSPMLRGDDVLDLQRRLNRLGFHAGREDGILGPDTARAIREFQRNRQLPADGIWGPDAVAELGRVSALAEGSVAAVREREALRAPRRLPGCLVYLATGPELEALGAAVTRLLAEAGAHAVLDASGAAESFLAAEANRGQAELFVLVRTGRGPACCYFGSGEFRSEGGFRVASSIAEQLAAALGVPPPLTARTYPALRETRMAAVVCELAGSDDPESIRRLVAHSGDIARALVAGIRDGIEATPGAQPAD